MREGSKFKKWKIDECRVPCACGLSGIMNQEGKRFGGEVILESMSVLEERGNGLGAGYAGYGIYPEHEEDYALHIMFEDEEGRKGTEEFLEARFQVIDGEDIPTKARGEIIDPPILMRYFVQPLDVEMKREESNPDDYMVGSVMEINTCLPGAFVFSSGKNMGVFKGVGFAKDIGEFYQLDRYQAYTWIGHTRFPTNTPGWWGGAHPFSILDWTVVHNGEISSYGINSRYLEMFGYRCTMQTDTEVMAYLFDLLLRKHGLPLEVACDVLASPFWNTIDRLDDGEKDGLEALRMVYGSALVNGPFAVIVGHNRGMIGLNDRIKLRPLVTAVEGENVYVSSEEAAIRQVCPRPEKVWAPRAGTPVVAELKENVK